MEREGKFLVAQVEDGVVAAGRAKRSAPKVVTEEQLLAIASQPIKRARQAAQEAKLAPVITSIFDKKLKPVPGKIDTVLVFCCKPNLV